MTDNNLMNNSIGLENRGVGIQSTRFDPLEITDKLPKSLGNNLRIGTATQLANGKMIKDQMAQFLSDMSLNNMKDEATQAKEEKTKELADYILDIPNEVLIKAPVLKEIMKITGMTASEIFSFKDKARKAKATTAPEWLGSVSSIVSNVLSQTPTVGGEVVKSYDPYKQSINATEGQSSEQIASNVSLTPEDSKTFDKMAASAVNTGGNFLIDSMLSAINAGEKVAAGMMEAGEKPDYFVAGGAKLFKESKETAKLKEKLIELQTEKIKTDTKFYRDLFIEQKKNGANEQELQKTIDTAKNDGIDINSLIGTGEIPARERNLNIRYYLDGNGNEVSVSRNPLTGEILSRSDNGSIDDISDLTPLSQAISFGKESRSAETSQERISSSIAIDNLDKAISLLNDNPNIYKDIVGKYFGIGSAGEFNTYVNTAIKQFVSAISGKVVTDQEAADYKRMYSPQLLNTPEIARFKLKALKELLNLSNELALAPYKKDYTDEQKKQEEIKLTDTILQKMEDVKAYQWAKNNPSKKGSKEIIERYEK